MRLIGVETSPHKSSTSLILFSSYLSISVLNDEQASIVHILGLADILIIFHIYGSAKFRLGLVPITD